MSNLQKRLSDIENRIRQAVLRGKNQEVKLLAVSKTVPQPVIAEAIGLGVLCFGENRVQEALPKVEAFPSAEWHFIGRLQTNKVKDVVGRFALVQSVDRWRLAEAIQTQAEKTDTPVHILAQVNTGDEEQKGGVSPKDVPDFLYDLSKLTHLRVHGLMTIPPYTEDPEEVRPYFRQMYELFTTCRIPGIAMEWLSMGMSGDYETAVEEGANLIRVGSALFGERN